MRELRSIGKVFDAEIEIYNGCKYEKETHEKETKRVTYYNIKNWEIVTGEDARKLEAETDGSCIDKYHEYLVLHFEDGDNATFRNSHVDMFRI